MVYREHGNSYMGLGFYGGPFIRLRWHYLEISYRALLNTMYRTYENPVGYEKKDDSWVGGFNSHITLGFRFGVERHKHGVIKRAVTTERND
jgi:hypothetical protein